MSNLITNVDLVDESKEAFLTYAEEVLTDRAIPSAEDGLLSVHRKILWTAEEILKMNNKSKYKKSASLVGSTLSTSYFHGDAACYGAMCKMAQPYLMRYPLIDGDGNFGSQEGNGMEASSRYTNARPSEFADLMFNDFKKNVVPLKETYNGEYLEPVVLPAFFPNALVNGKESIGISMAHNSLPNCLSEVCNGIIAYLKNENISLDEIMKYIPGPDFPLGGTVINAKDIKEAFATGHSKVSLKVRGDYEIKDNQIIFNTIPYRTYRNKIKEQINKNIEELDKYFSDFNDFSNVGKNKLVFTVRKGVNPEEAILMLFRLTDLQTTLSYNMNYIVNGTPKLCSLIDLIKAYCNHQHSILIKSAEFDKEKALARIHILEGLIIAVDKIDEVIALIKSSNNNLEATQKLKDFLSIDDIQAKAILDMKLSRLTKINKEELVQELKDKKSLVEECNQIINNKEHRIEVLINKILKLKKEYGDSRRTKLLNLDIPKVEKEKIIPEEVMVILNKKGEIKRIPLKNFKVQKRNGKGIKSAETAILSSISTSTPEHILLFSEKGKMYKLLVNDIPQSTLAGKGVSIYNLIKSENDKIVAATACNTNKKYVGFFTKKGLFKKTLLTEYLSTKRNSGILAIKLKDQDSIANVVFLDEEEILILTKNGMTLRFESELVSSTGRNTSGVKTIKLSDDDFVLAGFPLTQDVETLFLALENGKGKRVRLEEYPIQGRNGKGLSTISKNEKLITGFTIPKEGSIFLVGLPNSITIEINDIPKKTRLAPEISLIKGSSLSSATLI